MSYPRDCLNRVLLFRQLAYCLATLAAYGLRNQLPISRYTLALLSAFAALHFLCVLCERKASVRRASRQLSTLVGVASWTLLIRATQGVHSPFIAGLWLEIVLTGMSFSPRHAAAVGGISLLALWGQQLADGFGGDSCLLAACVQSLFLGILTAGSYWSTRRNLERLEVTRRRSEDLQTRLRRMEVKLQSLPHIHGLSLREGRLAHGVKNAVHSMRGLVVLLERRLSEADGEAQPCLEALGCAIDRLEELSATSLRLVDAPTETGQVPRGTELTPMVEEIVEDLATAFPRVRWMRSLPRGGAVVDISSCSLREVLTNLLRNAAEAMQGRGRVELHSHRSRGALRMEVRNGGGRLVASHLDQLFRPGFTTKPGGHGWGLFLARELVRECGGQVSASRAAGSGLVVSLTLPLRKPT